MNYTSVGFGLSAWLIFNHGLFYSVYVVLIGLRKPMIEDNKSEKTCIKNIV